MAQFGKAASKRGKPSYFMSILGVTLVLFFLGIIGWLIINANKLGDYFKENVEVRAYLRGTLPVKDSTALIQYISSRPYVKSYEYVDKEMAKKKYMTEEGNEDWSNVLDENPLPNSINFKMKTEFVHSDTLTNIKKDLLQNPFITDVQYPNELVSNMNKNIRQISFVLLGIAVLLCLVAIILIDNTIRLAMFSNRFLIKTMQMVGATRWFIVKPLDIRAIINGAVSGFIAVILIYGLILATQRLMLPELMALQDTRMMILLFLVLILIGIFITVFSTHRSVLKYLRMKLDELY